MRNIVDYMREVLSKNISTIMDNYEKTFDTELLQSKSRQPSNNVRSKPADSNIQGALNHSFINEAQSFSFGSQSNAESKTREILETDNESVHKSIKSAEIDNSTQDSSISNTSHKEKAENNETKETSF